MIDIETKTKPKERIRQWSTWVFAGGVIVVVWAGAFYLVVAGLKLLGTFALNLPGESDMATLLFAASTVALFLFSILVGGAAVFGWQALRREVRTDVVKATHRRIDMVERELRGRVLTIIGFMIGELHSSPDKLDQAEHKDYLSEAVWYCKKGYDILKTVEGKGRNMALNNLVYYTCLYGEALKCDQLLKQAHELKEIGQEYDYAACLLTYCRVVLQCSSDIAEIRDAYAVADGVLRMNLTERQKKEATFYVTSLRDSLAAKTAAPPTKEH